MILRSACSTLGLVFGLSLAAALLPAPAFAAAVPAPAAEPVPRWTSLTKAQQAALAPLQADWSTLDAPRKQTWIEVADRFPHMSAAERQRVQARMGEWARMTPAERTRARLQFQEVRELSPKERQAKWQAYQALPADQRRRLAQDAKPAARSSSAAAAVGASSARNGAAGHAPTIQANRAVTPIIVQAAPGATTTTLTTRPQRTHPHPAGRARIAAGPGLVDPATLLPKVQPPTGPTAAHSGDDASSGGAAGKPAGR